MNIPPPPSFAESTPPPVPPPPAVESLVAPVEPVPEDVTPDEPPELTPQSSPVRVRPVRRTESTRRLRPGDLICGECGEGNEPTRKFCCRCGESLAAAERVKVRWWRRLARWRRGPKVLPSGRKARGRAGRAGRSPRSVARGVFRKIRTYAFVVVLVFGLAAGLYPPLRTYLLQRLDAVKQDVASVAEQALNPARPTSVVADAETPEHPAALAFDQFTNTYWAAPFERGATPGVTIDLGKGTALVKVIVTSGASDEFTARHRPSIVNLAYSNEKSDTITLKDTREPQEFALTNGLGARTVHIKVLAVYPADGAGEVALTELEFFAVNG